MEQSIESCHSMKKEEISVKWAGMKQGKKRDASVWSHSKGMKH